MKYSDPGRLSTIIAAMVSAISLAMLLLYSWLVQDIEWFYIVAAVLLLFGFTYGAFRFAIEKFIYEKIRIIYKTIHNLKLPKNGEKNRLNIREDTIERVNQEVIEWGQDRTKEIEELKKMASYRREFIGNISHELKTPIFNIQGYVLTLLDGGLDDPTINREYLLRTERSINRMIAIVEDLEAIAQLESGELKLNLKKFDLVALAREVIDFLEIKAQKKGFTIYQAESYERPINVLADKERIRQVFINLIDNSIKYGLKSGGKTKVSFFDMDENILVEVTDNGMGISKQDLPRVFERFYRTDKARSREQGGTGLGLAIVKHIIEAHQQTINVRSTLDVGTTFAFTLKKER